MRRLFALAAAATAAAAMATGAAAGTPVTVGIVGCFYNHGGNVTVPAGSDVSWFFGWAATQRGMVNVFLRAATTTATVDGTPVADADSYWGDVTKPEGSDYWRSIWLYPTGRTLAAGDSTTIDFSVSVAHPVPDGSHGKPFSGEIDLSCTVTAV